MATKFAVEYWFHKSGFAVNIPGTNICAYSYPGSENSLKAEKNPERVARQMIHAVIADLPTFVEVCGYDLMLRQADAILGRR